jgi:hypothetical protein
LVNLFIKSYTQTKISLILQQDNKVGLLKNIRDLMT